MAPHVSDEGKPEGFGGTPFSLDTFVEKIVASEQTGISVNDLLDAENVKGNYKLGRIKLALATGFFLS